MYCRSGFPQTHGLDSALWQKDMRTLRKKYQPSNCGNEIFLVVTLRKEAEFLEFRPQGARGNGVVFPGCFEIRPDCVCREVSYRCLRYTPVFLSRRTLELH